MVRAKRENDGQLVAWHLCGIIAYMPFTGTSLDCNEINPYQPGTGDVQKKLAEVRRFIAWVGVKARAKKKKPGA